MITEKNHQKAKERTCKCFLTMLITVLQFRLKAVMTRQHTFLLKCRKFYRSFGRQRYDETTQACKTFNKFKNSLTKRIELSIYLIIYRRQMTSYIRKEKYRPATTPAAAAAAAAPMSR